MLHITQERCTKICKLLSVVTGIFVLVCRVHRNVQLHNHLVLYDILHMGYEFFIDTAWVNSLSLTLQTGAQNVMHDKQCSNAVREGGGKNKDHPHCLTSEENAIKNKMCGCLFLILFNIKIANSLKLINLRSPERHWTMLQRQATQKQALIRECNKVNTSIRLILLVLGNYKWLIWLVSD